MNKIKVSSDKMYAYSAITPVPKGQVQFSKILFYFSDDWSERSIIAQFKQGEKVLNRDLNSDNTCYIPGDFDIGPVTVYLKGYDLDGSSVATANGVSIPIVQGAFDGGEPAVPPEPDLYQKLIQSIQQTTGDLNNLKTEDKSSLVAAINEVKENGGGGITVTNTAAVGQTIRVSAVDGDGKPTEWEAVDIPTVDDTLTQPGQAADAAAVGEQLSNLSEEKVDKTAITLGVNEADGLVYIFIGGQPVGNGLDLSSGGGSTDIKMYDGTTVTDDTHPNAYGAESIKNAFYAKGQVLGYWD